MFLERSRSFSFTIAIKGWKLLRHRKDGPMQFKIHLRESSSKKFTTFHRIRGFTGSKEKHQVSFPIFLLFRLLFTFQGFQNGQRKQMIVWKLMF